jgi:hypothetical protein
LSTNWFSEAPSAGRMPAATCCMITSSLGTSSPGDFALESLLFA